MKLLSVLLSLFLCTNLFAEEASIEQQAFPGLPVKNLVGKIKEKVIQSESAKVKELLGEEKARQYMKQFASGYDSNTGAILIEGGENSWLEKAFTHGYQAKQIVTDALIAGYMEGLKK